MTALLQTEVKTCSNERAVTAEKRQQLLCMSTASTASTKESVACKESVTRNPLLTRNLLQGIRYLRGIRFFFFFFFCEEYVCSGVEQNQRLP